MPPVGEKIRELFDSDAMKSTVYDEIYFAAVGRNTYDLTRFTPINGIDLVCAAVLDGSSIPKLDKVHRPRITPGTFPYTNMQRIGIGLDREHDSWQIHAMKTFRLLGGHYTAVSKIYGQQDKIPEVVGSFLEGSEIGWARSAETCESLEGDQKRDVLQDMHTAIQTIHYVLDLAIKKPQQ